MQSIFFLAGSIESYKISPLYTWKGSLTKLFLENW